MIEINPNLSIPFGEIRFSAARSSGPGGQNVNKVNTRMSLYFDVAGSTSLTAWQKNRLRKRLATRTSKAGVLRVVCQRHRTQSANRTGAIQRFTELLRETLRQQPPRKKTRVPFATKQSRLDAKKHTSRLKQLRRTLPQKEWDE